MITLRPGSHVYRLLLTLAVSGEFPARSLQLLGNIRTLEDLVRRLETVQQFRTSSGQTLANAKCSLSVEKEKVEQSVSIKTHCPSCSPSIRQPSRTI